MPGPVIKDPTPDFLKPGQESVFDSYPKKAMRAIAKLVGADDPNGQIYNLINPTTVGLLAGVKPNKIGALREQGAQRLETLRTRGIKPVPVGNSPLDAIKSLFARRQPVPPELMQSLEYAQKRWPRVFGHMQDINAIANPKHGTQFSSGIIEGSRRGMSNPKMSEVGISIYPGAEYANTLGHEMLHTADAIAIPDMVTKYKQLNDQVGYASNPMEMRANTQGARMAGYMGQIAKERSVGGAVPGIQASSRYPIPDLTKFSVYPTGTKNGKQMYQILDPNGRVAVRNIAADSPEEAMAIFREQAIEDANRVDIPDPPIE